MSWDHSVDFLVIGSGAAGMTAALRACDLGADTLIVEKASLFGGTTALSGGVIWVPNNPCMEVFGISDSCDDGFKYLKTITNGSSSPEKLRTYVDNAPRMMKVLAESSHVRFECIPTYPDYYAEIEGGKAGGRSCEPELLDGLKLGDELFRMRRLQRERLIMNGRLTMKASEGKALLAGGPEAMWILLRSLFSYYTNFRARFKGIKRTTDITLGGALAARLRLSLMERGVPLWLDSPLKELIVEEGGVAGALVEKEGNPFRIRARKGVLLAAGGFERNLALREKYHPKPTSTQWTEGCDSNTGDTIPMGEAVGAGFDLMDDAWWSPSLIDPVSHTTRIIIYEKNLAGSIIVDSRGKRFMNEAGPYNDMGKAIYRTNSPEAGTVPAYMVFDGVYRKKYPCGPMMPGSKVPDFMLPKGLEGAFYQKDQTLEGLAKKLGIDPEGLVETVRSFNQYARSGKDLDFERGETLQDCFYAVRATGPNPSLAPLEKPPFYAIKVYPGDLGTKGGVRTDVHGRVLTGNDEVIGGLYASGNCSAVVMGTTYPGAGGTIGPAMTFGFLAAEHAMGAGED